MIEPNIAAQAIYSLLSDDATLASLVGTRIYEDVRPEGPYVGPYIVFQLQASSNDVLGLGARRVWSPLLYVVRGIARTSSYGGQLATVAERIDGLLDAKQVETENGRLWLWRERPFRMAEPLQEAEYRHSGGIYRINTQQR